MPPMGQTGACYYCHNPYHPVLKQELSPASVTLLWFQRAAAETFSGLRRLAPARGATAVVHDIAEGRVRGEWPIHPAHAVVGLPAAHTERCAENFKRRPGAEQAVHRMFAGGMRSQKALQHFYLGVLAGVSGAELFDVECTKNSVRFSVVGAEDEARVRALSKRLRCIGDSVVLSLTDDENLNDIQVEHPTMLSGHATPIEPSERK